MNIITDEQCLAYSAPGHPERPARVRGTLDKLRAQTELTITWDTPIAPTEAQILRAHTPELLARVKAAAGDFDGDTPAHPNIFAHACRSVGGALRAVERAREGKTAFSLLRPPGHHATRDHAMGFCYFNSVAIAALELLAHSERERVAVFDFDVHHGNGTEAVLLNHPRTAFFSIHQSPCYPGTGTSDVGQNCFNFPVAPQTPRTEYRQVLTKALEGLKKFKPTAVAVSAGFDAYARDPLAQETLEAEDFQWLGRSLRDLGVPTVNVLEGGYSSDLPELVFAFLLGLAK